MRRVLLDIFAEPLWQMTLGERAAVEGVLAQLRPALAIEIGTAQGACLKRIAAHSAEVHSFDLVAPSLDQPDHVTLHTGDSHELLPAFLAELVEQQRRVDFVMVDGDHTPEGVRQDLEHLLDSEALARAVILIHDTANERVRSGLDAVRYAAWPKVVHVELDWVPGRLYADPALRNELWSGLGLVVVDVGAGAYGRSPFEQRYHPAAALLAEMRDVIVAREHDPGGTPSGRLHRRFVSLAEELAVARESARALEAALAEAGEALERSEQRWEEADRRRERADAVLRDVMSSPSWRITKPLRGAKGLLATRLARGR